MDNFATLHPSYSHETRQAQLIAVTALCQCLSTFFFCCRVYSKVWLLRRYDIDDLVLLVAWLLSLATCITTYHEVSLGLGRHDVSVDPKNRGPLELDGYILLLLFIAMLPAMKISLCITYRRVFYRDKISRYVMDIVLFLLFLTLAPLFLVATFQCRPVSAYWNEIAERRNKCISSVPVILTNGISNVLTNVAIIVVAVTGVLRLQLHKRQRIALLALISLGWLAVVARILRLVRIMPLLTSDPATLLWDLSEVIIWTTIEIHISLICVTAPSIKPLLAGIVPRLLGSSLTETSRTRRFTTNISAIGGSQPFQRVEPDALSTTELTTIYRNESTGGMVPDQDASSREGQANSECSKVDEFDKGVDAEVISVPTKIYCNAL